MDCVVDASVAVKLYVIEDLGDRADRLFSHLEAMPPATMWAPELMRLECAAVFWKHMRRNGIGLGHALQAVEQLSKLRLVWVPTAPLVRRALELAAAHDITVYDATYVALASMQGLPLVTADERLVRCLDGTDIEAIALADYDGA